MESLANLIPKTSRSYLVGVVENESEEDSRGRWVDVALDLAGAEEPWSTPHRRGRTERTGKEIGAD